MIDPFQLAKDPNRDTQGAVVYRGLSDNHFVEHVEGNAYSFVLTTSLSFLLKSTTGGSGRVLSVSSNAAAASPTSSNLGGREEKWWLTLNLGTRNE